MDQITKPKFEGIPVYMDGRVWTIPPLSVRQFRAHYETLLDTDVTTENWREKVLMKLPVILAAIQRNCPEVTEEQLLDILDLKTFNLVVQAIANASGLRQAKPGE